MDIIANILCVNPLINFERVDFKKLAIACTLLSSKFTENDPNIPNVKDYHIEKNNYFLYGTNDYVHEIKKLEVECLIILEHKLNYSTPFNFLRVYYAMGFFFEEDYEYFKLLENLKNKSSEINSNENHYNLFIERVNYTNRKCENYLLRLIQENEIFQFKNGFDSFKLVSGIIYYARESFYEDLVNDETFKQKNIKLKKYNVWPQKLILLYKIKLEDFKDEYTFIKK